VNTQALKPPNKKDQLAHVAAAEHAEGEVAVDDGLLDVLESASNLCCVTWALSQQQDFQEEKPLIQCYIEEDRDICIFLPEFHCELDPIKLYWGWAKYSECSYSVCLFL
jgi:hypothetical protein